MTFVKVNSIPHQVNRGRGSGTNHPKKFQEFMDMNVRFARIDYGDEYSSPTSCRCAMGSSAQYWGFPIEVVVRNGVVYAVRTDMEDERGETWRNAQ